MRPLFLFLAAVLIPATLILASVAIIRHVWYPQLQEQPEIAYLGDPSMPSHRGTDSVSDLMDRSSARFPVIAMDLIRTSDGRFVCGHDWSAFGGDTPDLATVLANRNLRYAPCVIEELIAYFKIHPRASVYISAKDDPVAAANVALSQLGDRMIVEVSDAESACTLREIGVRRIVYSIDDAPILGLSDDLENPCLAEVEAISASINRTLIGHSLIARAVTGKPVWVKTANDCLLAKVMRRLGADALFSEVNRPGKCRKLYGIL